jgi:hypothetical protein
MKVSEYQPPVVHQPVSPAPEALQSNEARYVTTTPTPPAYFTKVRHVLLVAAFLFISMFVAVILVLSINSPKQHRLGQQPHIVRTVDLNSTEMEVYWEFSVTSGLQVWQEIPASGAIPNIVAPRGSVQKFDVSCTTVDGITLSKGFGFDALAFDARLRFLPINGDVRLLFYANNIELLQAKCTLFVKINPQF